MRKIFLDIGAYHGETLSFIKKTNEFDEIHSFEICTENCEKYLNKFKSDNIFIHNFGLLDKNDNITLYNPGSDGASIYKEKSSSRGFTNNKIYNVIKASDWFKENINANDIVIVKINCEGSETRIITNLIESGEYDKITLVFIWLDILKCKKDNIIKYFLKFHNLIKNKKNYLYGHFIDATISGKKLKSQWDITSSKADICYTIYNLLKSKDFDLYKIFDIKKIEEINNKLLTSY